MAQQNTDQLVYQQIEDTADFFEPAVYELLTFYSALSNEPEELDGQFIPLSAVPYRSPQETRIFAIGILPPSSNVTGRLLDRSQSISKVNPSGGYGGTTLSASQLTNQTEEIPANILSDPRGNFTVVRAPNSISQQPSGGTLRRSEALINGLDPAIQPLARQLIRNAAQQGINIVVVEGSRTNERQDKIFAQGRNGDKGLVVTAAKGGDSFHNYGLAFDIAMVGAKGQPVWPPPPRSAVDLWQQLGNTGKDSGMEWGGDFTQVEQDFGHFAYHPGLTLQDVKNGARPPVPNDTSLVLEQDAQSANGWVTTGSNNASQAASDISQAANRDINRTDLGLKFLQAQQAQIKATLEAIDRMRRTPPLRMLVNPSSFKIAPEKIIAENWGRNGPIVEHWGENQDKIDASGKIAGFYTMDTNGAFIPQTQTTGAVTLGSPGNGPGLGRTARQFSQSYQNFMSLWLLYKNNGGVWLSDYIDTDSSKRTNLSVLGSVYIYYDNTLYFGSFDNFSITESETTPFTLEYTFSFTVRATFLLDRVADQALTYGAPQAVNGLPPKNVVPNNPNSSPMAPTNPDVSPVPSEAETIQGINTLLTTSARQKISAGQQPNEVELAALQNQLANFGF